MPVTKIVQRSLRLSLALGVGLAAAVVVPTAAHAAPPASVTGWLQVWNLNTRHMTTDSVSNYKEFAYYITDDSRPGVDYLPDIVTLQEAGTNVDGINADSCQEFVKVLESRAAGQDYHCYEVLGAGKRGGSAVVYRTNRLSFSSKEEVRLKHRVNQGDPCTDSNEWFNLVVRLTDDAVSGKAVNVASVHLATSDNEDADCAWENMKLLNSKIAARGASNMQIMAGDWNNEDAAVAGGSANWECWYEGTSVGVGTCGGQNLGWKDAPYRACDTAANDTPIKKFNCIIGNHWTWGGDRRIDFLFAKAYTASGTGTVDYGQAYDASVGLGTRAPKYSDHRGQGAALKYY
ncbi:endonuclease/exonuclease/phosphatase family protein [Catellatospora sp. NPDC049111]|uniref:endonuclease/exonuclease/phosphatase family protein n=1 Tax=Catellatospora sp. NPDC049111 TaxID=3155271 RepID=UPI0033C5D9E4